MAGQKLSPRQKMINMMYLVLTAMLALNVSAEVLDAFVRIEDGFQKSIDIVRSNNSQSFEDFKRANEKEPGKVEEWLGKATQVRSATKKLYDAIDSLKVEVVRASEGPESKALLGSHTVEADSIEKKSDTDTGTRILVGEMKKGKAYQLEKDIASYKETLLKLIDGDDFKAESLRKSINGLLSTEVPKTLDENKKDWPMLQFYNSPLISTVSLLSKVQLDVLSSETAMLNYLYLRIDGDSFKFSQVQAIVKANSEYIIDGGEYRAEIFLAAYDPNMVSTAIINGRPYESVNGKISYNVPATGVGPKSTTALMKYVGPNGFVEEEFKINYNVIAPTATVSPSKMNVLYSGIPNPLEITVGAGVSDDKINVQVQGGGSISKGNQGFYWVTPSASAKTYTIVVSAEIDGKMQSMGKSEFRVKPVPKPTAVVDGVSGKSASKGELSASQGLRAQPPADFEFDAKFTITSFMVSVVNNEGYVNDEPGTGAYFNDKHRRMFSSMRNNSQLTITNIKANGPSGSMDLPDLVIRVK